MEKMTRIKCNNSRCLNNRRGRCFASEIEVNKRGACMDKVGAELIMVTNKKGEETNGTRRNV